MSRPLLALTSFFLGTFSSRGTLGHSSRALPAHCTTRFATSTPALASATTVAGAGCSAAPRLAYASAKALPMRCRFCSAESPRWNLVCAFCLRSGVCPRSSTRSKMVSQMSPYGPFELLRMLPFSPSISCWKSVTTASAGWVTVRV